MYLNNGTQENWHTFLSLLNISPPQPHSGAAVHSLVTAFLQGSQAWDSGTAPSSGLGDGGVSQETEHKYGDSNNLITSGVIMYMISEAYPGVFV